jgi:hypothetical protein
MNNNVVGVVSEPVVCVVPPKLRAALLTVSGIEEIPAVLSVTLNALSPWAVVPRY